MAMAARHADLPRAGDLHPGNVDVAAAGPGNAVRAGGAAARIETGTGHGPSPYLSGEADARDQPSGRATKRVASALFPRSRTSRVPCWRAPAPAPRAPAGFPGPLPPPPRVTP